MKKIILIIFCFANTYLGYTQNVPSYVPTNGLVGWWPFSGNAVDSSGNGNNGTVNGATLTTDRFGNLNKAYYFNGVGNNISVAHSQTLAIQSDITISIWKKSFGNLYNYESFVNKRSSISEFNYTLGASHYAAGCPQAVNKYVTARRNNGGAQYELKYTDYLVSNDTNQWIHIVLTIKSDTVKFYINGLITGYSCYGNKFNIPSIDVGSPLTFGSPYTLINEYFYGNLDDIGIWNRALTPCEVHALYAGTPVSSNLVAQDSIQTCGDSVLITAASGFNSYNWSNGSVSSSIYAKNTGWYKITASNTNGCSISDSVFLSIVNATILNNDTTICSGSTITLNAFKKTSIASCSNGSLPTNLQNGLVAFYPFCGNANDMSGNSNDATITGALLTLDRFNNNNSAYILDGIDDYITTNASILNSSIAHTISTWIQIQDTAKTNQTIFNTNPHAIQNFAFHYSSITSTPPYGLAFGLGNSGWNIMHPDNGQIPTPANLGVWHNIVWVKTTNQIWKFYFDGNLIYSYSSNLNTSSTLANLRFGAENANYPGGGANLKGKMDDIGIWNRALTDIEIAQLYQDGSYNNTYLWSTGATTSSINVAPTQTTKYWLQVSNGISTCTDSVNVEVSNSKIWTGATSSDWSIASNWMCGVVPTSTDDAIIPASVINYPTLSVNSGIKNIAIASKVILNGKTFTINGALTGAGTIKGSTSSSLSFTGSTNNTLKMDQTTAGTTNVLKNLTLSGTGTTTLGNALNITAGANSGSVTAGTGTTLTTGGFLTLKSDASGTARIAQSAGTISGNVTQERYVPGKAIRKWSFLASPVTQSLASAWQQQIHITGAGTGGTMCNNYTISGTMTPHTNGFDVTQLQNPSFYTYDAATDNFVANTTGTTAYTLTPGDGYMVLVRGDRNDATNGGCVLLSANNQAAFTSTSVTLAATGAVGQGTITKVLPAGYSFIGNPYPCEIDFPSFNTTNTSVITGGYWTYYPTNATYTFSTYNNGTSTNGGTQVIANGQSFLVNSTSGGTITFNEAHKSTTANNGNFRLTKTWDELIRVGLSNNQGARYDEVVVRFGNDAAITKALNEYDAASVNGGDQWIKTLKETSELAIQTRPNTYQNDTVSLAMHAKNAGTYQLNFSEYQGLSNTEVYLIDQQENLIQNVKALPSYEFSVGANTTTANRFKLIFDAKTSGVAALATKAALQVYPNPTKDKVRITCDGLEYGAYQIKVRTITGVEVLKAKGTYYQNEVIELSLQDLASGMYMLELTQDNGLRAIQKINKQ